MTPSPTEQLIRRSLSVLGSDPQGDDRVAQALEEYAATLDGGTGVSRESLLVKYADVADELIGCLDSLDFIRQIAPQLSDNATGREQDPSTAIRPLAALGDFRIVRELGRGGMGVVYEAEQLSLGRRVALKVLPFAAMLDQQQLVRFKNEARAAATLEHPNIVSIHSVGVERGVHYYAMRLVEGQSLAQAIAAMRIKEVASSQGSVENGRGLAHFAESAEQNVLVPFSAPQSDTARAALSTFPAFDTREYFRTVAELGIQAAQALDHAHQHGIVHRDVKPANLLVDNTGKLWITDFGLARLETDISMTMTGDLVGTLRYMSPEQAQAKRIIVDHRTDIYSLGITLYELLALRPAFGGDDRQHLLHQIACDEPPHLKKLNRQIPIELETIIEKAIRKNPEDRYATAQDLAEDLRCFLANKPIRARPPSRREQVSKWTRRHPTVLRAAAILLFVATFISVGSALLISDAYRHEAASAEKARSAAESESVQRTLAETNARRAEAVSNFLVEAFRSPAPEKDGRTITIAQVLDRSAKEVQEGFADEPIIKADLLQALGQSFIGLGLYREAIPLFEASRELRSRALAPDHPDTLKSMHSLANAYGAAGRIDEAVKLAEHLLELRKAKLGPNHSDTLATMSSLATGYRKAGRNNEALSLNEELLERTKATSGPDHRATLASMRSLAIDYIIAGRIDEAVKLDEEVLNLRKAKLGPDHPDTLTSMGDLAAAYRAIGRYKEALNLGAETVELMQAKLGPDHPETLGAMGNLAIDYHAAGRNDEALKLKETVIELMKARLGTDHPNTLSMMSNLAISYRAARRTEDAMKLDKEVLELRKAKLGSQHPDTLVSMNNVAVDDRLSGRNDEALKLDEEVLALWTAKLGQDNPQTLTSMGNMAVDYRLAGRYEEALELLVQVLELRKAKLGPDHPDTLSSMNDLANQYSMLGRFGEAKLLYEQAIKLADNKLGPTHSVTLVVQKNLGALLRIHGEYAEATALSQELIRIKPDNPTAYDQLWRCLSAQGKKPDSAELREFEIRLREFIHEHSDSADALVCLGNVLCMQERQAEAAKPFREAIRLQPQNGSTYKALAVALIKQAKSAAAIPPWAEATDLFVQALDRSQDKSAVCDVAAQWDEVFNRMIELRPDERALWLGRGQFNARRGRWSEAAANYAKGIRHSPIVDGDNEIDEYAYLLLMIGDVTGYEEFCRELAQRHGDTMHRWEAFQLARACAAAPSGAVDQSSLMRWAKLAAEEKSYAWFWHVLALAQYRTGDYAAAIESSRESNALDWSGDSELQWPQWTKAQNWLVMSMAHYRLGQAEEARQCLATARKIIGEAQPKNADEPVELLAADWIPIQVLLREAESLLHSGNEQLHNGKPEGSTDNGQLIPN